MSSTTDPYTYPSAPELRAALTPGTDSRDHWALREMRWCQETFGFAIAEAGRGGPIDRYAVFTVGLGPEFVVIGQAPETARLLLTAVVRRLDEQEEFIVDEWFDDPELLTGGISIRVEAPSTRPSSNHGLTARIVELPLATEHALFAGGLFRHPDEAQRTPMLQILPDTPEEDGPDTCAASNIQPATADTEASTDVVARHFDEVKRAEKELFDRLWYHYSRQHEYQLLEQGNDAELDRLLTIAASGRRRVEGTYTTPGELGPYTDFELGMLNGKLSALRWVLGWHWDFLDL